MVQLKIGVSPIGSLPFNKSSPFSTKNPWIHGRKSISKTLPTDPCFAYPKPPGPTVYVSEFPATFGGDFGDVWGMRNRGMLGFP